MLINLTLIIYLSAGIFKSIRTRNKCCIEICDLEGKSKIFTARKRSLGQGNDFAPVCHSVHRGGVSVGVSVQGISVQGWVSVWLSLFQGWVSVQRGVYPGGLCLGEVILVHMNIIFTD